MEEGILFGEVDLPYFSRKEEGDTHLCVYVDIATIVM